MFSYGCVMDRSKVHTQLHALLLGGVTKQQHAADSCNEALTAVKILLYNIHYQLLNKIMDMLTEC
jgi:hypothetical protein